MPAILYSTRGRRNIYGTRMEQPMARKQTLTASQEDYLETIFHILGEKPAVRPKDIAAALKVKAASVTGALKNLSNMGLINYAPYDYVSLTEEGQKCAEEIVYRHKALQRFFTDVLGVKEQEADEAACKMEHSVPRSIVERLVKYSEYVERCPGAGVKWESGFGYYCEKGCLEEDCQRRGACERGCQK